MESTSDGSGRVLESRVGWIARTEKCFLSAKETIGWPWWIALGTFGFMARVSLWPIALHQKKAWMRPKRSWTSNVSRYSHVAFHAPMLCLASLATRNLSREELSLRDGGAFWFQDLGLSALGSHLDMPMGASGIVLPLVVSSLWRYSVHDKRRSSSEGLVSDWTALAMFLASCLAPHATVCYWTGNHVASCIQSYAFRRLEESERKTNSILAFVQGAKTATEGDEERARALFERATKLDERQVHGWIARASLAQRRGDSEEAERCLRVAVSIDPRVHATFLEPFLRTKKDRAAGCEGQEEDKGVKERKAELDTKRDSLKAEDGDQAPCREERKE